MMLTRDSHKRIAVPATIRDDHEHGVISVNRVGLHCGNEAFDLTDQQVRVINPMREHVAKFPRARELGDLPPADRARAPIL